MDIDTENKIDKSKVKVRKACDNCRKRKLKCTGKQPCSTCEAYSCSCIYSARSTAPRRLKSKNQRKFDEQMNKVSGSSPVGSSMSNISKAKTLSNGSTSLQVEFTKDGSTDIVSGGTATSKSSDAGDSTFPTTCKANKSKLGNKYIMKIPPIIYGDNHLYENDEAIQIQINNLQIALNQLKSIPVENKSIITSIESINNQIETLISSWKPIINEQEFAKIDATGEKSRETYLMKNKYTDHIYLTRYSIYSNANYDESNHSQVVSDGEPLVDELFGLYSPVQIISLRGIGCICLEYLKRKGSKEINKHFKECLYLILRYFDMCYLQMQQGKISIANPLEAYFKKKNITMSPQSPDPSIPITSPSSNASTNISTRTLLVKLIGLLPQPFTFNCTGVTTETLLRNMGDDFSMFQLLVKMFENFKIVHESFFVEMTSIYVKDPNLAPTYSNEIIQKLIYFCEIDQILLPLCYHYYSATQYFYYKAARSIDYMELLISLIDKQLTSYDYYGVALVIEAAINIARKMGLSRWEYYVGLDENKAERRRYIWWKLYYFNKIIYGALGEPSTINDEISSCLLPKFFRDLGFLDSRTFVKTVTSIPCDSRFEKIGIESLEVYGRFGVTQLMSDFGFKVLFSEKYTSIRNSAAPPLFKSKLFEDLIKEYKALQERLQALRTHCSILFEIAASARSTFGDVVIKGRSYTKKDGILASRFACTFEFYCSVLLATIDNLEARLSSKHYTAPQFSAVSDLFHEIYHSWHRMNCVISNFTNDYSICRVFVYYRGVTVLVLTKFELLRDVFTYEDIRSLIYVLHRFKRLWILNLNEDSAQVRDSAIYREYCKNVSFLCLASRVMVLMFCRQRSIELAEVRAWFESNAQDLLKVFDDSFDITSKSYKYLLTPVQKSGFHLHAKQMLENNLRGEYKGKEKIEKVLQAQGIQGNGGVLPQYVTNQMDPSSVGILSQLNETAKDNRGYMNVLPALNLVTPLGQGGSYLSGPQLNDYVGPPQQRRPAVEFLLSQNEPNNMPSNNTNSNDLVWAPQGNMEPQIKAEHTPNNRIDRSMMSNISSINEALLPATSYNLGTLDEFVNSDIGNMYNILWSDIYPDNENHCL